MTFTRKDTLRFAADSSYSRAILRYEGKLVFGTSKTGVISYDEQLHRPTTLIPPVPDGEFRDVIVYHKQLIAMVSGNNGLLFTPSDLHPILNVPGVFFDDLATNGREFSVLGDPVDGHFFLGFYHSLADSIVISSRLILQNVGDEACYAASGTTGLYLPNGDYCFVSGGKSAVRFHKVLGKFGAFLYPDLPMAIGEGAGPFSVHFTDNRNGAIVGGNYTQPKDTSGTAVYTTDGGITWHPAETMPGGYRSCVTGRKGLLFACGSNGIDVSTDGGKHWKPFDSGNYCALLLEKKTLYATTNKGTCIRYSLN